MTIGKWLAVAIKNLEFASIPTARLDAEVLLADELSKDRSWLHANSDIELQIKSVSKLDGQIDRRMKHEPLAYIRGKQEFYGREFYVSPDTLTPRPETETMIEMLLKLLNHERRLMNYEQLQIMDMGTGSGCIIITSALELSSKDIDYHGLDISAQALRIARDNARKFNADVKFSKIDLTNDELPISTSASKIVLANLPYVPNDFDINLAASHEPSFAIYGGTDGLDYYRVLFKQLKQPYPIFVFTESLPPQHSELKIIAENAGFELMDSQDLIQVFQKLI